MAAVVVVLSIAQTGCAKKTNSPVSGQGFYLDTVCIIDIYETGDGLDESRAKEIINDAFILCGEYEDLFSRTREGSDIYRINHAGGESVVCDERTIELIKKGIYYGELSEGLFDISIGRLTELWDFHAKAPKVPAKETLDEAVQHVDFRKIQINEEACEVMLEDPQMMLDCGGLAKGYIADRISEYLADQGVTSAVISLGGNVVCIGSKVSDGIISPFKVGIEAPYSDMTKITKTLELTGQTAVTSGVYERFFEENGKKYHHILNPSDGYPVDTDILSATIVSGEGNSCDCDALSTICLMMGKNRAEEFIGDMDGFDVYFTECDQ